MVMNHEWENDLLKKSPGPPAAAEVSVGERHKSPLALTWKEKADPVHLFTRNWSEEETQRLVCWRILMIQNTIPIIEETNSQYSVISFSKILSDVFPNVLPLLFTPYFLLPQQEFFDCCYCCFKSFSTSYVCDLLPTLIWTPDPPPPLFKPFFP